MAKFYGWENPKWKDYPEIPRRSSPKKKNNRWCRGKADREHQLVKAMYYGWPTFRCLKCNTWLHKMDDEVRAKYDKAIAERLELEKKWCQKGHLYDWVQTETEIWTGKILLYRKRQCLMCGKETRKEFVGVKS